MSRWSSRSPACRRSLEAAARPPRTAHGRLCRASLGPLRRTSLAVAGGLLLWALAAGVTAGHAIVVRTEPADGSVLDKPPARVVILFSEPISLGLTRVTLTDSRGRAVEPVGLAQERGEPTSLVVTLPQLRDDVYRVAWTAVSDTDLHTTSGTSVFAIGSGAAPGTDTSLPGTGGNAMTNAGATPSPAEVILGALELLFFCLAVGGLGLAILAGRLGVRPVEQAEPAALLRSRLLGLATLGALGAVGAGLGRLGFESVDGRRSVEELLTRSTFGGRWALGELALVGVAALAAVAAGTTSRVRDRRTGPGPGDERGLTLVAAGFVVVAGGTRIAIGHLGADPDPARLAVGTLHLLAATAWVGGLLGLAVVVLPFGRDDPARRRLAHVLLRRVGLPAAASVALLAVSGLLAAGVVVATPEALIASDYGRTLLLKTGLASLVGLLGLRHATSLQPPLRALRAGLTRRLRLAGPVVVRRSVSGMPSLPRSVRLEAAIAILVVAAAAWLGATPPARGPAYDPPPESAAHPTISGQANDLLVTLAIRPNRPGRNIASIGVFDTRRPAPAPIDDVTLVRRDPLGGERAPVPARRVGDGRYEVGGDLFEEPGRWLLGVVVERVGMSPVSLVVDWEVPPVGTPTDPPRGLSQVRLADLAPLGALVLALILGGFATWLGAAERQRAARRRRIAEEVLAGRRQRLAEREAEGRRRAGSATPARTRPSRLVVVTRSRS